MIRRWLKKLIAEAIIENLPPCNISIETGKDHTYEVNLDNMILNNSKINVGVKDSVNMNECVVNRSTFPIDGDE